ncbi:hypothetical protein BASA61_007537 [Batrachochytrium salamandrivorans]|nr:hypothetical protein BASA61_007537 [Batrachochytrium salamandrivorans]
MPIWPKARFAYISVQRLTSVPAGANVNLSHQPLTKCRGRPLRPDIQAHGIYALGPAAQTFIIGRALGKNFWALWLDSRI